MNYTAPASHCPPFVSDSLFTGQKSVRWQHLLEHFWPAHPTKDSTCAADNHFSEKTSRNIGEPFDGAASPNKEQILTQWQPENCMFTKKGYKHHAYTSAVASYHVPGFVPGTNVRNMEQHPTLQVVTVVSENYSIYHFHFAYRGLYRNDLHDLQTSY